MRLRPIASAALRMAKNEPAVRLVLARSKKSGTRPIDWFRGMSDDTWFWLNTTGRRRRSAIAAPLPGLPENGIQDAFTGNHGDATLREGFDAYRLFKNTYETRIGPLHLCPNLLDFGCGWGRIIRYFLKDVEPGKLVGVDHSEDAIRICQETNKWARFKLIDPYPPIPLSSGSFGLIYLYSVFSHLPEQMHWALLREFHRLLEPSGMLIATTRPRDYIYFCKALRDDPKLNEKPDWLKGSARIFPEVEAAISAYDNGQFCYDSFGAKGRWSFWGEACIPKGYVSKRWPELFDVCDYIDDRNTCPQNVIVARKRDYALPEVP